MKNLLQILLNRTRQPLPKLLLLITMLFPIVTLMDGASSAQAASNPTYHVVTDVGHRNSPTTAPDGSYGIPNGAGFVVECQVIGQAFENGNALYFRTTYGTETPTYVPDYFADSPHLSTQPPLPGIPMCGAPTIIVASAPVVTAPAAAPAVDPAAWIGSPINGTWPNSAGCAGASYPSADCSLPWLHHVTYNTTYNWGTGTNDWAADLQGVSAGTAVKVYAAPQNAGYDVTAKVDKVGPACASGRLSDGGSLVQVGFYVNGLKIGSATYAHINPTVRVGQPVSRWGAQIGTVGSYTNSSCWQGAHVHVELSSRKNYACYSKVFQGTPWGISESNFIGFIGGSYAAGVRRACP